MGIFRKIHNNTVLFLRNKYFLRKVDKKFSLPPIIIGGCGRSGTSLLLSILSAHPQIYGIPKETYYFCPTAYTYDPDYWAKFDIKGFYNNWVRNVELSDVNKSMTFCEKSPKNVRYFQRILKLFNNRVKIINIIRDGRDVVLSKHPTDPSKVWSTKERWVRDLKYGIDVMNDPNVFTVRYEDLINNFEDTVGQIFKFLQLNFDNNVKDWYLNSKIRTHGAWKDGLQPINSDSVGKWKNENGSSKELTKFLNDSECIKLLKQFNYEV
jgi:hypothetical protein